VPRSIYLSHAYRFNWSHEIVLIDGVTTTVKVAHVRLCHSRMPYFRADPQEMMFDAQDKAFAFLYSRGIYENMNTAVNAIFVDKDRAHIRRFQHMCGHYLVDAVACNPASGWEKGQVENQVGVIRCRFFVPRPKFKSYAELSARLEDRCMVSVAAVISPKLAIESSPPGSGSANSKYLELAPSRETGLM